MKLEELAGVIGGKLVRGDGSTELIGVSTLAAAGAGDLSFLANQDYRAAAGETQASALITSEAMLGDTEPPEGLAVVFHDQPYLAWAQAVNLLVPERPRAPGIHRTALVDLDADVHPTASIGPFAVVGPGAKIGAGAVIGVGAVVQEDAQVGEDAHLSAYVVVRPRCIIGPRCHIEPHCVIGVRGFGYATDGAGVHHAVPQVGATVLEAEVEMGSHCAIDRGAVTETRVGRGTKMGNQNAIGHNVTTGPGCLMVGHVALAGSSSLGHHVVMAGKAGLAGHTHIGDQTTVMAYSAVTRNIEGNQVIRGIPARDVREVSMEMKLVRQLPEMARRLAALEAKVGGETG